MCPELGTSWASLRRSARISRGTIKTSRCDGVPLLHNGVERHLPIPVVTTIVCSVVVLHSPLIFRYFLLRLGDHCRRLTAAVLWKYLDQPVVPLESPPWTMLCTLRSPLPRPSGHHPRLRLEPARVLLEEIARECLRCCVVDQGDA